MKREREKSFTYSVRLPPAYEKVLNEGRKYLNEHPDYVGKIGKLIFVSDVFRYALDILADTLEIDFKVNNREIEFVSENKQELHLQEVELCRILSSKDFSILEEYRTEGYNDTMTVFEFCDFKGIDWKKVISTGKLVHI